MTLFVSGYADFESGLASRVTSHARSLCLLKSDFRGAQEKFILSAINVKTAIYSVQLHI